MAANTSSSLDRYEPKDCKSETRPWRSVAHSNTPICAPSDELSSEDLDSEQIGRSEEDQLEALSVGRFLLVLQSGQFAQLCAKIVAPGAHAPDGGGDRGHGDGEFQHEIPVHFYSSVSTPSMRRAVI